MINGKVLKTAFIVHINLSLIFLFTSFSQADVDTSEPISLVYKKQEFTPENFTLRIEQEEEIIIAGFENVTRVMVVTPNMARAYIISPQEVSIVGGDLGTTFIHAWDAEGLITLKLYVNYKGYKKGMEIAKKYIKKKKEKPIRIGYDYDVSKSRMDYDNKDLEWKSQNEKHSFNISGDTPYGYFDGKLSYLFRKNASGKHDDVRSFNAELKNDFFTLSAGDITTSFSDLTLPRTHYQGLWFTSGKIGENIKCDVVAGSTGYYLWGSRLSSFGQLENKFYGLRTEVSPEKDVSLFATLMKSDKATHKKADVARHLGSIGAQYKIGENFGFKIEAAKNNKDRTAFSSSITLNIDKLSINTSYKDVTVDYLNLTGNAPGRGRRGVYTTASFNPLDILSFSSTFNVYQNRLTPDPDSVEKGNRDFSFDSKLSCPPTRTQFLLSYYHRDNRAQRFPVVSSGQFYKVSQRLRDVFLLGNIKGELSYRTSRYKSYLTGISNYKDKTLTGDLTIRPIRGLSLLIQETLNFREWAVRDYSTSPRRFYAGASYGSRIGKLPLFVNMNVGYQIDSHVNQDKISVILGEEKITGGAGLRCSLTPSLTAFLNAHFEDIKGSTNPELDRFYTRIDGGVKLDWDTGLTWQGYGTIKGYVFKDMNKNGIMDKGDIPMKGVRILIDKKESVFTSSRGFYRIRYIKTGLRNVSADIKTIPKDYVSTTPLNVQADINRMDVKRVNFGLAPKAIIGGFIFNDLNRNKVFDKEDKPLPNVLVMLDDGKKAFTMSHGHFTIRHVMVGKRAITIDKNTVPKDLLLEPPTVRTVVVEEGQTKEVQFIFYASRFIAGKVYVDYNNNKEFDENEGIGNVKLTLGDKIVITDEDGSYVFRDLPAGKVEVIVDRNSIPPNCKLKKDTIEVTLGKESITRKDVNIKLLQKP